jgi:hypothetical protein
MGTLALSGSIARGAAPTRIAITVEVVMRRAIAGLRGVLVAGLLLGATGAQAASANDPDLRGAWKGTGADAKWVANFLPNDTYQFRLGDSPTGSRGQYIARNGKFELLEGKQKFMYGSYRIEDCRVLVLDTSKGIARFNRSGTPPTGACGKVRTDATPVTGAAAVPGSVRNNASGAAGTTSTIPPQSASRPAATPGSARAAPTAQPAGQKSVQAGATAKATTKKVTAATQEGAKAVKTGAVAFWSKARDVSKTVVTAGGKAAKTVGHKAQEAGHAVVNTVRKAGDEEPAPKPDP